MRRTLLNYSIKYISKDFIIRHKIKQEFTTTTTVDGRTRTRTNTQKISLFIYRKIGRYKKVLINGVFSSSIFNLHFSACYNSMYRIKLQSFCYESLRVSRICFHLLHITTTTNEIKNIAFIHCTWGKPHLFQHSFSFAASNCILEIL